MARKGISLPIEIIIVIAIAILVLIVLAAFFIGGFGGAGSSISHQAAFGEGCSRLRFTFNCDSSISLSTITIPGYRDPGATSTKSLADACNALGYTTQQCRVACNCPAGP